MSAAQKTAFILQIHKNPGQVNKFIHQLISNDQADVYIHIDKRNDQIGSKLNEFHNSQPLCGKV